MGMDLGKKPSKPGRATPSMNVTPLVDVVLVLLIIFMVVTPLIASGVAVDLPRTQHHERKPDDGKDIIVSVTKEEKVYVGRNLVQRPEDLGNVLTAEKRRFPDKSIFLKGDARAPYGAVRVALQAMHQPHALVPRAVPVHE